MNRSDPMMIQSMVNLNQVVNEILQVVPIFRQVLNEKSISNCWIFNDDEINQNEIHLLTRFGYKIKHCIPPDKSDVPFTVYTVESPSYPSLVSVDTILGPPRSQKNRDEEMKRLNQAIQATQSFCAKYSIPIEAKPTFDWKTNQYLISVDFNNINDIRKIGNYFSIGEKTISIKKKCKKIVLPPGLSINRKIKEVLPPDLSNQKFKKD